MKKAKKKKERQNQNKSSTNSNTTSERFSEDMRSLVQNLILTDHHLFIFCILDKSTPNLLKSLPFVPKNVEFFFQRLSRKIIPETALQ